MAATDKPDPPRVHAGKVDQFKLDKFRIVETAGGSVGVVRTAQGFFAVINRCPHMGAPVCVGSDVTSTATASKPFEYVIAHAHCVVRCPWHRWEFRIDTGENIGNVTKAKLMTYDVDVDGEDVYIRRRKPSRSAASQPSAQ